ncbi:GrpB family protein [Paenibacillus sp. MBLB4367]|uniref:GrpB family protein n=1 Tax=Paenibacillus sp. MBLB4367 TaxID=3384767 RepID=UPI00390831B3
MSDPIVVVSYSEEWPRECAKIGTALRQTLGGLAVRIDHSGSTSVAGLAAKPVIDIQISVQQLEPVDSYKLQLESAGFIHKAQNPDLTKRYFREAPGSRRTHIHVRESGSWPEQAALMFRDYLREHADDCATYAEVKYRLAELFRDDRHRYVEEKGTVVWEIMRRASEWSQRTGWKPGASDY